MQCTYGVNMAKGSLYIFLSLVHMGNLNTMEWFTNICNEFGHGDTKR